MIKNLIITVLSIVVAIIALNFTYERGRIAGNFEGYEACKSESKELIVTSVVKSITFCESSDKHNRWGDSGKAYGIAQFHKGTFNWMAKLSGHPEYQWKNKADQIALLDWAIRNGYGNHWQHCYKQAVKTYLRSALPNLLQPVSTNSNLYVEVLF